MGVELGIALVLLRILHFADDKGFPWRSGAELAAATRISVIHADSGLRLLQSAGFAVHTEPDLWRLAVPCSKSGSDSWIEVRIEGIDH